jgi:tetratricopeptide (TPR) repeat protein
LHRIALHAAYNAGNRLAQADALTDIGDMQYLMGDYKAATESLSRSLEIYRGLADRRGEANALTALDAVQQVMGDYRAATGSLARALELYRDLGDPLGEANALSNLGAVQQVMGDYRAAETSFTRSLELYRDLHNGLGEVQVLNNLGELSLVSAHPWEARTWHEEALMIATSIPLPLEEARALEGLGNHYQSIRPEESITLWLKALEIYQRIGSPRARRLESLVEQLAEPLEKTDYEARLTGQVSISSSVVEDSQANAQNYGTDDRKTRKLSPSYLLKSFLNGVWRHF